MFNFKHKKRISELEAQLKDYKEWEEKFSNYETLVSTIRKLQNDTGNLEESHRKTITRLRNEIDELQAKYNQLSNDYNETYAKLQDSNAEIVARFLGKDVENFLGEWSGPEEIQDKLKACLDWEKTWNLSRDIARKKYINKELNTKEIKRMRELLRQTMGACYNMASTRTIEKMSKNGLQKTQTRLANIAEEYNKMGEPFGIFIDPQFVMFKTQEAQLKYDYLVELEKSKRKKKEQTKINKMRECLQAMERAKFECNQTAQMVKLNIPLKNSSQTY